MLSDLDQTYICGKLLSYFRSYNIRKQSDWEANLNGAEKDGFSITMTNWPGKIIRNDSTVNFCFHHGDLDVVSIGRTPMWQLEWRLVSIVIDNKNRNETISIKVIFSDVISMYHYFSQLKRKLLMVHGLLWPKTLVRSCCEVMYDFYLMIR